MPLETHAPNPPSDSLMPPTSSISHRIDSQTRQPLPLEGDRQGQSTPGMVPLRELAAQINREHERCQQSVADRTFARLHRWTTADPGQTSGPRAKMAGLVSRLL